MSGLTGSLLRLSHFDETGFSGFDASRSGFGRSFLAALLCMPIWMLAEYEQLHRLDSANAWHSFLAHSLAFLISWLAYPLMMVRLSEILGVWPNYYRYMVAYNWFRAVLQLIWLPLLLLDLGGNHFSPEFLALLWLSLQGVELTYDWFLARHGLKIEPSTAIGLALIDFLLSMVIDQAAGLF